MCLIPTCRLCDIVNTPVQNRKIQDTLFVQTTHFEWVPGLGAFVEGYSLVLSKQHVLNTGAFDHSVIRELASLITQISEILKQVYHTDIVVCEHGSMGGSAHAGSCVEHHHLHIFPVNLTHIPQILIDNFTNHRSVSSLEDLVQMNREKVPYIYYSTGPGNHEVFEAPILPRQYMRQVLAAELNLGHVWDWREYPFEENVAMFVLKVESLLDHKSSNSDA